MGKYLVFPDAASARGRNRQLMDKNRDPNNAAGDGKSLVTEERYSLRIADDGTAVLEIKDSAQLTSIERGKLLDSRPAKFDPPKDDDDFREEVGRT